MTERSWTVFEALNPTYAAALSCYDRLQQTGLRFVMTNENEQNLYDSRSAKGRYLHSQRGAFVEAKQWVIDSLQSLEEKTNVLLVYGIGLGWYWKALLPWVERKKERQLIFLEDDLEIIAHFVDCDLGETFFSHPQSHLIAISGEEDRETIDCISWNLFQKSYRFLTSPSYKTDRPAAARMLEHVLHVRATDIHLVAAEFSTFGIQQARNSLRNLTLLQHARNGQDLFQQFQGIPIVVVAAGPSLQEAIPFLRKWQNRALIIAGGSAINALIEAGILPHAAVIVDPNPLQYSRMKYLEPFHLPLFFRSRALHEAVVAAGAFPLLHLKGSDGYPFVAYLEDALGIAGTVLDGGDSVGTLLVEFAAALGAVPIVMVGYTFGYKDKERYSASLQGILHESEQGRTKMSETQTEALSNRGMMIQTEPAWIVERDWVDRFVQTCDIQIINSAVDGLLIPSVPCKTLDEIDEMLGPQREDILARFLSCIHSCTPLQENVSHKNIAAALEKISVSLEETRLNVEKILDSSSGRVIHMGEFESSFAFTNLLSPFWKMHQMWMEMKMRLETPYSEENWREIRHDMEEKAVAERFQFMRDAIAAYQQLLFSYVSWMCLQGEFLPDPYTIAPWPEGAKQKELFVPES